MLDHQHRDTGGTGAASHKVNALDDFGTFKGRGPGIEQTDLNIHDRNRDLAGRTGGEQLSGIDFRHTLL
jgi:hypothetical protein